jgi:hypothetical protein
MLASNIEPMADFAWAARMARDELHAIPPNAGCLVRIRLNRATKNRLKGGFCFLPRALESEILNKENGQ